MILNLTHLYLTILIPNICGIIDEPNIPKIVGILEEQRGALIASDLAYHMGTSKKRPAIASNANGKYDYEKGKCKMPNSSHKAGLWDCKIYKEFSEP